ncbi:cupin domain-containing protein [Gracilimonas mengyeensis]|uniref:Uncharacterized protein YjlB n=1 Tax=Gracilimonas mengyeensis TaxID=1302730 RepID=A0A521D5G0_9BACT|nr:cupin domain-containing protein [Gracilimonas mengyeensis]SMO66919.1 Uncharacterized protein YjlB [Gracilimonas mengyeensis]
MQPEKYFFDDDGNIPNNKLPLLLYRDALNKGASGLMDHFRQHSWSNAWKNGVFSYHHYHSNAHEVLGVYSGTARLQLGGENGKIVDVAFGDVIIIPAGVGHKNLQSSADFGVVGAYPNGSGYDLKTGKPGERPQADKNIAEVPIPETDPVVGKNGGLVEIWNEI